MANDSKALVIVESPAKARTISAFLPDNYTVEASIGHVRDLPGGAKDIPKEHKGKPWARLGIDVENDFAPLYIVPPEKKKQVSHLKKLVKNADILYLATDEDREGESISWHLKEVLDSKLPLRRLVFHEITREAIEEALAHPRDLDEGLIAAQEARRILDRLYGYEVSPILWRKIAPRLSAGRVQSVAVRLIVERERARRLFITSEYWDLKALFATADQQTFEATLIELDGRRLATGKDFDSTDGTLQADPDRVELLREADAIDLAERLANASFEVASVKEKPYSTKPAPPFTTSTLQQEANRKLRFSARRTMSAAQRLYENGHITYMRTDSTTLAASALTNIRKFITERYGEDHLAREARQFQTKVKNAQEAHEAIRPSLEFKHWRELAKSLGEDEARLYELIWKRTIACQMAQARGHRVTVRVTADDTTFQASGKTIDFPGFLRAYAEGSDDPEAELADKELILPSVKPGDPVDAQSLEPKGHTTQPPARFTEASLVKELEALGIGRPSTYASIIETILRRQYVVRAGNALVPTFVAFAVSNLLAKFFSDLVDVEFTARLEDVLDAISNGDKDALPYLREFYFGANEHLGLKALTEQEIDARESCTLRVGEDENGHTINVRVGKYGPFLERGTDRASIPEGMAPDELTIEKAAELLEQGSNPVVVGTDPETDETIYAKTGRYGPYVQLGERSDDNKPKMKSLLPGMTLTDVSLEQAKALLELPRVVGYSAEHEADVTVDYGRYGAYLRCGKETRSLDRPEAVFDVTLEEALAKLKEEKKTARRGPKILKELGKTPEEVEIKLLDGRFGPYVTDGEINASIPRGTDPTTVGLEQALELIEARRAAGPRKPRARKKTAAKKKSTAKKKTAAKKTARKAPAKRAASKKTASSETSN